MLESCYNFGLIEAGCDEAGRGCLAGPVFAAAVILPNNYQNKLLNDSKKLSLKSREILRKQIEYDAIDYAVASVSEQEIDKINILNASIKAMHLALDELKQKTEFILVDGNKFKKYNKIPHLCIIKGDGKYLSIAAASILAKTYRDEYMEKISKEFPVYNWEKNKGYPTKEHKIAINKNGICKYHRKSYKLYDLQLKLF
jgi:ribonuclease HII